MFVRAALERGSRDFRRAPPSAAATSAGERNPSRFLSARRKWSGARSTSRLSLPSSFLSNRLKLPSVSAAWRQRADEVSGKTLATPTEFSGGRRTIDHEKGDAATGTAVAASEGRLELHKDPFMR